MVLHHSNCVVTLHRLLTWRTFASQGGLGTREEMCLAILSYYPRVQLQECISQPQLKSIISALGVQELYHEEQT